MRIVVNSGTALLLGFGVALAGFAAPPARAQTVIGGDNRPDVVVDTGVLDRLGPEPTLPDLLLGRQPTPIPTTPIKLHRPRAEAAALHVPIKRRAEAATTESQAPAETVRHTKKTAHKIAAAPAKPAKPKAVAEAAPLRKPARADDGTDKTLVSSYETPPPRPPAKPATKVANIDMPAGEAATDTPPPAPAKLATTSAQQSIADATPAPAPAPAPAKTLTGTTGDSTETPAPSAKQALLTPPPQLSVSESSSGVLSIPFDKDGAALSDSAHGALLEVAKRALSDPAIQVQVLAYASGDEENASKARRLSLSRALAVRSFLIDQGVHSTRIEVRALGNRVPDGPPDRVDLIEQKH